MIKLTFSTTNGWDLADGFGCASLGLPGVCDNRDKLVVDYEPRLKGVVLTGKYEHILHQASAVTDTVHAAIVLFGNAGGENRFIRKLQSLISCPVVGGGAACDPDTGRSGLITGGGEAAVLLITDSRYTYTTVTKNIHSKILECCEVTMDDPRTALTINGVDAASYLNSWREKLGLKPSDFEHLTLSDESNVNAHLSCVDGMIKSGRDLQNKMLLRYVQHEDVYAQMETFYNDHNAIVFGCAGLSGLLDRPLNTDSMGLFLFGEVCCVDGVSEFGNLMLSKLVIQKRQN